MAAKVAKIVDGTWTGGYDKWLGNDQFQETLEGADVAIVDTRPFAFEEIKHLKGIVRLGVGYDNLPLKECREAGIALGYTPHAPSQSAAEHALALMLAALRFRTRNEPGVALQDITVGVIGRGRIGKRFITLLRGLGVNVAVVDPLDDETFDEINYVTRLTFREALGFCDVISLHAPAESETENMINRETLSYMNSNAVLVNTARGSLVDETALKMHLIKNRHFTAALDVHKNEPDESELSYLPNCIMTPHVSSMTLASRHRMEKDAISNVNSILSDGVPVWEIPEREPWHK